MTKPNCPTCKTELEYRPPICKDDPESPCDCDSVWHCDKCNKTWFEGCTIHHYAEQELDLGGPTH